MALSIAQEQQGEIRILALSGRLDNETAADLELMVQDLLAAGDRQFLFDLAGVGYVSSAGLRTLESLLKQISVGRGNLRLCSLTDAVRQVFEVAGFLRSFVILADRNALLRTSPSASPIPADKPDSGLAGSVAKLLGATQPADRARASLSKADQELAQQAAQLLGKSSSKPKADGKAKPGSPARSIASTESDKSAVKAKPRGTLGDKK
jgi:anti-sigma B factor antagonist